MPGPKPAPPPTVSAVVQHQATQEQVLAQSEGVTNASHDHCLSLTFLLSANIPAEKYSDYKHMTCAHRLMTYRCTYSCMGHNRKSLVS